MMMTTQRTTTTNTGNALTPALLHDIAAIVQRVVPRDDGERQAVERYMTALGYMPR